MTDTVKLSRLTFRAGPSPSAPPLEIIPSTVVVFVGPNNSGKSLTLREIEDWCWGKNPTTKVIADVQVSFPQRPECVDALVAPFKTSPPPNQVDSPGYIWISQHTFRPDVPVRQLQLQLHQLHNAARHREMQYLLQALGPLYTVRLDGRTRFGLSDPKPTGDLLSHPQNHLWALFQNDEARERVRKLTEQAFGLYFVVDPTGMTNFRMRMSDRAPSSKHEEQGLDVAAREFHRQAKLISEFSDGVQAFTGLVSAVMSLPHRIMLIDEPEAFLHPTLARRLGNNLATLARERSASLVVATHSADFLMGCITATPDTTIVRLTYERGTATARALPGDELRLLMLDPLLRSTGALEGVFHRAVIVTEGDADRAFYDEINRRLQEVDRGVDDALFLNAQNWQTIPRIVRPLRNLGIPAAAIIDLDAVATASGWDAIYEMMNLQPTIAYGFEQLRSRCESYLKQASVLKSGQKAYKVQGIDAFGGIERQDLEQFVNGLAEYGVFIVPVGELERWLSGLTSPVTRRKWLSAIFGALGSDPGSSDYVRPGHDDVWAFVDQVANWTRDSNRKGLP